MVRGEVCPPDTSDCMYPDILISISFYHHEKPNNYSWHTKHDKLNMRITNH